MWSVWSSETSPFTSRDNANQKGSQARVEGGRQAGRCDIQADHTAKPRVLFLFSRFKVGAESVCMFPAALRANKNSVGF